MKKHHEIATIVIAALMFLASSAFGQNANPPQNKPAPPMNSQGAQRLDMGLKPTQDSSETISQVFKEMVVVQRKAKEKANHFLLNLFENFDFSDGPTTLYGTNINVGYALSDYFEIYANYIPFFVANPRSIVSTVNIATNGNYQITYSTPQNQFGLEFLWAPAYGKDAWGPYTIIRSDTYFKAGFAQVQYTGTTGGRYSLTIGKTFFISQLFNLRLGAGGSFIQIPENGGKDFHTIGLVETGLVWYL